MQLPDPYEHNFTPTQAPTDLEVIEPLLEKLEAMPLDDYEQVVAFLKAWDETERWIGEHIKQSQLATQVNTEDQEAEEHWMHLVQNVLPALSSWDDRLNRKLLDAEVHQDLESSSYAPFVRQTRKSVELFREENIPLQRDLQGLTTKYNQISGGWKIEFRGETYPKAAMSKFTMAADRETREEAWYALSNTVLEDADALDDLWEEMFELRQQVAQNADYDDFRDYIFAAKQRDYGPEECYAYHDLIEAEVVPLVREISEDLRDRLGVDSYRPWDTQADPTGGDALSPFETADQLQDGVERMMKRLDPELGSQFNAFREYQDLDSRPAKSQGGFMMMLPWTQRPFIFANASGVHRDIVTLLHEAGHAFHYVAGAPNNPMAGTSTPMEFNEVASMAMELLHYDTLDEFYTEEQAERAIHEHLRRLPRLLASVARGDAWQHWAYTNKGHTRTERHNEWLEQEKRFSGGVVDWSGIDDDLHRKSWHHVLHFFVVPFYFIEYGFAQLGALQVAVNAEEDPVKALKMYKDALALGPQRDTFGLYEAAGAEFIPTQERVRELMNWIRDGLGF